MEILESFKYNMHRRYITHQRITKRRFPFTYENKYTKIFYEVSIKLMETYLTSILHSMP